MSRAMGAESVIHKYFSPTYTYAVSVPGSQVQEHLEFGPWIVGRNRPLHPGPHEAVPQIQPLGRRVAGSDLQPHLAMPHIDRPVDHRSHETIRNPGPTGLFRNPHR